MAELDNEVLKTLGGITSETILQDAAKGDFSHIMELKDHFVNCSPETDNLLATECAVWKRNLIHWLAYYKELEILEWICGKDSHSVSSFSNSWPTIALERGVSYKYFIVNAQDAYGFTALHLATLGGHEEIVKTLLAYDTWVEVDFVAENMKDFDGNEMKRNGQIALHIAAAGGKLSIVKMLVDCLKDQMQDRGIEGQAEFYRALWIKSTSGKTALHYAAEHGKWEVVRCLLEAIKFCGGIDIVNNCDVLRQTPLYLAVSHQNAEVVEILLREGENLKVNIVTWEGITPLDKAKSNEVDFQRKKPSSTYFAKKTDAERQKLNALKKEEKTIQRIVVMLESYDVNWLQAERAKYANAANCLLVGAALIATVTYAGWLQPPLGITQYYEFPITNVAAPPGSFESYVGVLQHQTLQLFWIFNSLFFFCSIATFIIGADAGIPKRCTSLREEVVQLRQSTVTASFILSFAIIGVMGAFSVAGILVLPPIERQRASTYVTVALGVIFCFILLMQFMRKLWIWFWSPSLQFKREWDHSSEGLSLDDGLLKKGTPNDESSKHATPNDGPLMLGSANFGPSKPGSPEFGSPKSRSVDLESPMPESANYEPSAPEIVDFVSFVPRSASMPSIPRSRDFMPTTSGIVDFMPTTPGSVDSLPSMPKSANFVPFVLRSGNYVPSMPKSANFVPPMPKSADSKPLEQRRLNKRPCKQRRANILEPSNSKPQDKQKDDNVCGLFEEQWQQTSAKASDDSDHYKKITE